MGRFYVKSVSTPVSVHLKNDTTSDDDGSARAVKDDGPGRRGCRFGALRTAKECFKRQRDAWRWRAEPGCTRFFGFAIFSIFSLGTAVKIHFSFP
jgi:hypothetical protein